MVATALAPGSAARSRRTVVQAAAVLPRGARRLGALPGGERLRGAVVMRPRDEAALQSFIARVTDPASRAFHRYLPAGAFARRFGPEPAARTAVSAALRADGLRVGRVSADGLLVPFSGATAAAERAFATTIHAVRLPGGGRGRITATPASLPRPVAGAVAAVVGLDETTVPRRIGLPPTAARHPAGLPRARSPHARSADTVPGTPAAAPPAAATACPAARTAAQVNGGLTDAQIADAYGASGLYAAGDTGAGQRIALYELEPFLRSDVQTFDTCYFGAKRAARMLGRVHVVGVDGGQPHGPGSGEASLDVENLSALAPGARIDVYVGPSPNANPSTYDALDEYVAIVDADRDRVVSTSWGLCEQAVQRGQPGLQEAENLLFQQAAAQGQTILAAAGDNGADDCNTARTPAPAPGQDPVSVDDPASQPYVVGVGGTAIDDAASTPPLEHVWDDGAAYGAGGGGISESWPMTAWQQAARVPGIARPGAAVYRAANGVQRAAGFAPGFCDARAPASGTPCRLVPDVSAQADEFTGGITVYSRSYITRKDPSGWTTTGGTSSAAPIWAASLALVNASPACTARAVTRGGVGFAAPLLYRVASDPAQYAASFHDVRTGGNDLYGLADGRAFAAGRGYDLASGLGSPRLTGPGGTAGLAIDLCGAALDRPAVTAISPRVGATTGGERLTIHGTGFAARGGSRVSAVQVGSRRIPAARVRVRGPRTLVVTLPAARSTVPPAATAGQDGAGPAAIVVTRRDGSSSAPGPQAMFTYLDRHATGMTPSVGAISPTGGPQRGGPSVTILGAGFDARATVTFGGVRARRVRVDGPDRISVTPPPRGPRTRCAPLPRGGVYARETAATDICQVQVRVRDARGTSLPTRIRPPLEGPTRQDAQGDVSAPPGCRCELAPAADEFDYLPRPRIAAVSTDEGPGSLAGEHGGTVITVHGAGLNPLDLEWADFGDPRLYSSVATGWVFVSGTEMQIRAPARALSAGIRPVAFSVRTLAGQSAPATVRYAGEPAISRVVNTSDPRNLHGLYGGPDTGRTPLVIEGHGMRGQVLGLQFTAPSAAASSVGTQYTFHVHGDTRLTAETVAENPAIVAVQPCTVTGCPKPATHDLFWLYPPGAPRVDALTPASGPAAGGTAVTIGGENLGCALRADFGATPASALAPVTAGLQCGSTETLSATSPPGPAGAAVPVSVETAESFFTGTPPASTASFAYR